MPLLSHDHLSRLHWHGGQLFSDSESTRIRSRDMLRHDWKPCRISIKCRSMLFLPIKTGWAARQRVSCSSCIARQQRLYAAAAAAGLAESSDPACYETQAAERSHEEPGSGQLHSSPPDKESSLQLFLPASYSSSPPLHGHWTNPELLEGTLHITCYAALLNAA